MNENKDDKERCACFEFVGDNPDCPVHGDIYREQEKKEGENDGRRTQG